MKLPILVAKLKEIEQVAEKGEFENDYIGKLIIQCLLDYIGNPKVEESVNDIPF